MDDSTIFWWAAALIITGSFYLINDMLIKAVLRLESAREIAEQSIKDQANGVRKEVFQAVSDSERAARTSLLSIRKP
jgi:hypothetical protein